MSKTPTTNASPVTDTGTTKKNNALLKKYIYIYVACDGDVLNRRGRVVKTLDYTIVLIHPKSNDQITIGVVVKHHFIKFNIVIFRNDSPVWLESFQCVGYIENSINRLIGQRR